MAVEEVGVTFALVASRHALDQAWSRFPEETVDVDVVRAEVDAALKAGRRSVSRPVSLDPPDDPTCIYVWTEDEERVYALRVDEDDPSRWVVTTCMRAGLRKGEVAA